jgi:hypothetical protein
MKPTFALDLTRESIGLLHRTPKGWLPLGEVAFDAPDLSEALDYLRKTALGLSPMGVATKVVLPNSQILYTEVHAPGPSREDKRKQILTALEGRTPYPVDDLVIDWSGKGATVKVAVVARETLAEAEAFATQHRLNPVSFVAIPEDGNFVGEPWFGPTEAAPTILAKGESVDRDRDAIVILQRDLPVAEKPAALPTLDLNAPELAEPSPLEADQDVSPDPSAKAVAAIAAAPDDADDPLPGLEEAFNADITPELPEAAAPEVFVTEDEDSAEDFPASAPMPAAEPVSAVEAAPAMAEVEEAPFAHVTDPTAFPEADDDTPAVRPVTTTDLDDDLPPAPPSAAMVAFASRRSAGTGVADPRSAMADAPARAFGKPVEDLPPLPRAASTMPKPLAAGPARNGAVKGFGGLVTAPSIPGSRKAKGKGLPASEVPRPAGLPAAGAKTLTKPGGTFGARTPQRGKPRYLGMILTALLLVCLALMAAWSSLYLEQGALPADDPAVDVASTDAAPGVDDEMLADIQDPEGMTEPLPEAEADVAADGTDLPQAGALATESTADALPAADAQPDVNLATEDPADLPVADTALEAAVEPVSEPAPQTQVTTDLVAAQPLVEDQDEIFLAAMDAPPPALDALALPVPQATADAAPDQPVPPPPFGTVYQFDAKGLLKPTPDGILSPDGVFLVAGKPPLLPPARSDVATAAAQAAAAVSAPVAPATDPAAVAVDPALATTATGAADPALTATATTPAPSDPAMAGFRPRPRPDALAPGPDDDAALVTGAVADFAGLRPLPRPASVLAAASSSRPAEAVATDLGAQGASLTAQREATLAAAAAEQAANPSIIAISRRPAARPRDLSRAVEAAVAAAVREPAPEEAAPEEVAAAAPAPDAPVDELNEPDTAAAAPKIPTKANVAKQATFVNAINLSKTNLIGVYGSQSKRYALIRQSNGRYKKVKVGDKVDGGTVQAITENEVRYQKGGKLVALKMPKA